MCRQWVSRIEIRGAVSIHRGLPGASRTTVARVTDGLCALARDAAFDVPVCPDMPGPWRTKDVTAGDLSIREHTHKDVKPSGFPVHQGDWLSATRVKFSERHEILLYRQ